MTLIVSSSDTIYGSGGADIIIGTGAADDRTIKGLEGQNLILSSYGPVVKDVNGTHVSAGTALSLDAASYWTTGSNALVGDGSVPHMTVVGTGNGTSSNWYAVTLAAGQTLTVDVDFASGAYGGVAGFDSEIALYNPAGSEFLMARDAPASAGGAGTPQVAGSTNATDAYASYTATTSGIYRIQLGAEDPVRIPQATPAGAAFLLNVSVTGHAATGTVATGDTTAYGGESADYLVGGSGVDHLSGNGGNDLIYGGAGNDVLAGNNGNDLIDGGTGADYISGGAGDDTYHVDNAGDVVKELDGGGTDQIYSSVSYALTGGYVETLRLTGSADINATGNAQDDTLYGNDGDNVLNGLGGVDTMYGGAGDDTYYVDNIHDRVFDYADQGNDTVYSSVSYTVQYYIETAVLTGTDDLNVAGNDLDNTLIGNSGDNILNGRHGADRMIGGQGDDTYYVENVGDVVIEAADGGQDRIYSTVSYSLAGQYVETLILTDDPRYPNLNNIDATGNSQANSLIGNSGDNVLNGMGGADRMTGGAGNDTYYVDNVGDVVIEAANGGTDQVFSTVSFSLAGQYIEKLTLTGSSATNATGNSQANILIGNDAANILKGGDGLDTLTGGGGIDRFRFDTRPGDNNIDSITDFTHGQDLIELSAAIYKAISKGVLADDAFFAGSAAHDASDRILYDASTGNLFYDADGLGGVAAVAFATVTPGLTLTAHDFAGIV